MPMIQSGGADLLVKTIQFTLGFLAFELGIYLGLCSVVQWAFYQRFQAVFAPFKIQSKLSTSDQLRFEVWQSIKTFLSWTPVTACFFLLVFSGHTNVYWSVDAYGWGYFWLSLPMVIVFHDASFYWLHRFWHSNAFLFRTFHHAHHVSTNPGPFTALSVDVAEGITLKILYTVYFVLVPTHIFWIFAYTAWATLINVLAHSGVDLLSPAAQRRVQSWGLNTATLHNIHHQRPHQNFGFYFSYWDKLMKTVSKG
jgi:Delta7-sterol 5-desaturase